MLQINPFLDCTVCTEIVVHIVRNNHLYSYLIKGTKKGRLNDCFLFILLTVNSLFNWVQCRLGAGCCPPLLWFLGAEVGIRVYHQTSCYPTCRESM